MKQGGHYREILRLVSRIARLANPQHLPVIRRLRISQAQFLVLAALGEAKSPLRMSDLAQAAGLPPSELTRVVDELLGKEWIARSVAAEDNRARLVTTTRSGARVIAEAHEQAGAELQSVWSDFTHDEWHRFTDYLERFATGLARAREASATPSRRRAAR